MPDPRYEIWAKTLVGYSVEVQPGQTVAISGGTAAEPLLRGIYREVLTRGGYPVPLPLLPGLATDLLRDGTDDQLRFISPLERFVREEADVAITVMAETNTRALSQVDPARQTVFQSARSDLFQTFMRRAAEGTLTWVGTLFPTDAYAQDAGMATEDYADFVFRACKLDQSDPVAAWQEVHERQQRLIDWLAGKEQVRLTGPDVDLTLSIAGEPGSMPMATAISRMGRSSPARWRTR